MLIYMRIILIIYYVVNWIIRWRFWRLYTMKKLVKIKITEFANKKAIDRLNRHSTCI